MHINSQLGFSKFQFSNGQAGGTASLCQILSKSLQPRPRYGDFSNFQDGGRRHVVFLKFQILTVEKVKKVEVHRFADVGKSELGKNKIKKKHAQNIRSTVHRTGNLIKTRTQCEVSYYNATHARLQQLRNIEITENLGL